MPYQPPKHDPDCRWERTTHAECEYRDTHYYCPHPEHACNCAAPKRRRTSDLVDRLRMLVNAPEIPEGIRSNLATELVELEAWERATDQRH